MEDTRQKSPPGEPMTPKKSSSSTPSRRRAPRRRQNSSISFLRSIEVPGNPIPTIEVGNLANEGAVMFERSRSQLNQSELLAPQPPSLRFTTPPPKDRLLTTWDEDMMYNGDSIPASSAMKMVSLDLPVNIGTSMKIMHANLNRE